MKQKMQKLKILFAGTADFAVPSFQRLLSNDSYEVVGLLTQPDRPVGRKQELQPTPIKGFLLESEWVEKVPIFAPERLSSVVDSILEATSPDLVVVAAYGQFIPNKMLKQPRLGAINIHGSLLPELRGAVPVQLAILNGLEKTGVTVQKMVKEMDAGDIFGSREVALTGTETTEILMSKLAELGADLLLDILPQIARGELEPQAQNESLATFCYQKDVAKEKAEITARTTVDLAERMVRAFYPWPVAWLTIQQGNNKGKRLKIFASQLATEVKITEAPVPHLFCLEKQLYLSLSNGALLLKEVQLEGKQRKPGSDYLWLCD